MATQGPTYAPAPFAPMTHAAPTTGQPPPALTTPTPVTGITTIVQTTPPSVSAAIPQVVPLAALPTADGPPAITTPAAEAEAPALPMPTPPAAVPATEAAALIGAHPPAAPTVGMAPPPPAMPTAPAAFTTAATILVGPPPVAPAAAAAQPPLAMAAAPAAPAANAHAMPAHIGVHAPHVAANAITPAIAIMPAAPNTPKLQGISAEEILNNHHPTQRAQWEALPGPKGLILPFDPGYTMPGAVARVPLLQRAIKHILNLPDNPKVGCPTHDASTSSRFAPPHFYLLAGLSVAQLNILATTQVWSTDAISFFVLPFTPPLTTYVASFTGLLVPGTAEYIDGIEDAFRAEILGNPRILTLVTNFHDNIDAYTTPLDALTSLTDALSITAWESPEGTIWNLYIGSPTRIRAAYEEWVIMMEALRVFSVFEGSAVRTTFRHCTRCLSHDHTTNSCPFPCLPGWRGDGPLISRPRPTRGRGSQRGNFSRGRGFNSRGM